MKNLILFIMLVGLIGCASAPIPKTKWTDKNMRVMIDPDSIPEEHYVQVQNALVRSSKFTVVDRAQGLKAAQKEQERLHRNASDRFEDKEKWAHWGKLYGVGSIVVAHVQCVREGYFWDPRKTKLFCKQFLSMVDANTGEVILAVNGENDGPASADVTYLVPDWDEIVAKLVTDYPRYFKSEDYTGPALAYQKVSEEHAKRQREIASPKVAATVEKQQEPKEEKPEAADGI